MEQENNNKKVILPIVLGITVLSILVLGATYAYYTVGTTNSFGSKTISATTPETGSVALRANNNISMILTNEQMIDKGVDTTYYGVSGSEGIASETETTVPIGEVTVVGNESFDCDYTFTVTKTPASGSMYEAFQSMGSKSAGQIVLTITPFGGTPTVLDFNTANLFTNQVISGTVRGITKDTTNLINAQLKLVNKTGMDQGALAGTNITISIVPTTFTCELHDDSVPVFEAPTIGNFVTLDNQAGIYYRVLYNESGTNYMLLRMNNDLSTAYNTTSTTVAFENGASYQKYAGSTLDTYMNSTFYNTLSTNIKNAIVDKNIDQKAYQYYNVPNTAGDTTYTYQYQYNLSNLDYDNANYVSKTNVGTRHVYALEIDDMYKYMSALKGSNERVITSTELNNMFYNSSEDDFDATVASAGYIWFRSAYAGDSNNAWYVSEDGGLNYDSASLKIPRRIRPAFLIDLSKVDFAEVDPTTITPAQLGN